MITKNKNHNDENYNDDIGKYIENLNNDNEKSKYLLQRWYNHILLIQRTKIKIYLELVYKTLLKHLNIDCFDSAYILSMNLTQINDLLSIFPNSLIFIRAMFEIEILTLDKLKFELVNYQLINNNLKLPRMNELNFKIFELFLINDQNIYDNIDKNKDNSKKDNNHHQKKITTKKVCKQTNVKKFKKNKSINIVTTIKDDDDVELNKDKMDELKKTKICSLVCDVDNCKLSKYIKIKNEQVSNFQVTNIIRTTDDCCKKNKKKKSLLSAEEIFTNNIYGESIGDIQLLSKYIHYKLHSEFLLNDIKIIMDRIIQNMLTSSIKLIHEERQFDTCIKLLNKHNYICNNDYKKYCASNCSKIDNSIERIADKLQINNRLHWIDFENGMYGKHQSMTDNKNSNLNADMIIKNKQGQYLIVEMKSARDKQGAWHRTKEILSTNIFLNDVINNFYNENVNYENVITFKSILIVAGSFTNSHLQLITDQKIEVIWEHNIASFEKFIE